MRRVAVTAFLAGAALAQGSAPAEANPVSVMIQGQAFAPTAIDALPDDRVTWSNMSDQTHTVTANDGLFDSGYLSAAHTFSYTFTTPGTYAYHCIIHRGMVGEIDVREVTLDPLPPAAVAANSKVSFSGRTADTSTPVGIQMQTAQGFHTVATATPNADGSWSATLTATKTARYRAQSNGSASEIRRLLVINRTVKVRVTHRGIAVTVAPSTPYGLVALQYRLRDRFGWWIVARKRLDYVSTTTFGMRPRAMTLARVVLLGPDHWTPVATSRVVRVGPHK